MDKETIISEISDYLLSSCPKGTTCNQIYVGIAADAEDRLFNGHAVDKENDVWIYRTASSDNVAREIEKHFLDLGFDGGPGGGDENTKKVYCFLKNSHTKR